MEEHKEIKLLAFYCFDILINHIKKLNKLIEIPTTYKNSSYPVFVTWKKQDKLRGCIGTFASDSLEKNLPQFALASSMNDPRFKPIKIDEVKELNVGVSLLINFEKISDPKDWEVGKHGITIEFFDDKKKKYRGTYLPEVAKDMKWDQEETLLNLAFKAGYRGKLADVIESISTERYQSLKCNATFEEYFDLRKDTDFI